MSEEYIRMGRGGAGNMFTKSELHKKEEDLEAQKPHDDEAGVEEATQPPPLGEYMHMGRGGAGNWFVPAEHAAGVISDQSEVPTPEPPTEHPPSVRPWRGRGGAGNFVADSPQEIGSIEKEEAERAMMEEERIRASVEQQLQKPSQAHMKGGEKDHGVNELGWREAGL